MASIVFVLMQNFRESFLVCNGISVWY